MYVRIYMYISPRIRDLMDVKKKKEKHTYNACISLTPSNKCSKDS